MDIVLLGSGRVATHLGKALNRAPYSVKQVWSRDITHARDLASDLQAEAIDSFEKLREDADLYILAVADDAIPIVVSALPPHLPCIVHTSGSTDMAVFAKKFSAYGVIYPLQTFSKQADLDFKNIPLLIEGNQVSTITLLKELSTTLSDTVLEASSEQRQVFHIAAVFACNFTNHLYRIAEGLLQKQGLPFELIRPLIMETATKAMHDLPSTVQTGPAARHDTRIVQQHVQWLSNNPSLQELYIRLSTEIQNNER